MADGDPILIFEVGGEGRLELAGADLPERGVEMGTTMRLVATRYPGRSVASTQVMGTEERQLSLRGVFSDVLGGASGHALAQAQRARALVDGQRLCELQWGTTVVRRGYVREFVPSVERQSLIRYTLTFEVTATDQAEQVTVEPFATPTTSDVLDEVYETQGATDDVEAAARGLRDVGGLGTWSL